MVDIKEKKAEAIKRMKLLKLFPNVIEEFKTDNIVYYSEGYGILYWLSNEPEWEEFVKDFEQKHNALVYHAELSYLEFGNCLSLFYVSDYKDEWEQDYNDLKENYALCYVWNTTHNCCSEFGSIAFKPMNGGIKRVG